MVRTAPAALEARRTEVTERLANSFAHDEIPMEEFERRLALVDEAQSLTALDELIIDLPAHNTESLAARASTQTPNAAAATTSAGTYDTTGLVAPNGEVKAFFGSVHRRGVWRASKALELSAVFGSVDVDFREAALDRGLIDVNISCWFGSIELTVPPDVNVVIEASARLGSIDDKHEPVRAGMPRATLRVRGAVTFGNLEVRTRHAGETKMGATIRRAKDAILGPRRP